MKVIKNHILQACMKDRVQEVQMSTKEIENLVYEYGDDIYRFCCYLTSNRDMADELYQETFLKAVQLSNKLNRSGNCKSFLMGIATNLWKNYIRKKTRRNVILPEVGYDEQIDQVKDIGTDVLEAYVESELINEVKLAVNRLPEKQRLVVLLYYAESLSTVEISHILHIPKGTVLSRLAKARENLKKEMEAKGYEV